MSRYHMARYFSGTSIVGAVLLLAAAVVVPTAHAQEESGALAFGGPGESEAVITREEAIKAALTGGDAEFEQLIDYIASAGGDAEGVADAASDLIRGFAGDADLLDAAARVADAASEAMSASRVESFSGAEDFLDIPADGFAFNFTTSDSDVLAGFERVTPNDSRLEGANMAGLRRPADSAVVSAGVTGVTKFRTRMPNGRYRITIMTDDLGDWSQYPRPLGNRIIVNGNSRRVLTKDPSDWLGSSLGNASVVGAEQGIGGAIVLEIEITGDELVLEFPGADNIYLAGLIVEPIEEFEEDVDRFDAEERIAVAVAETLAEIVTDAGEPDPVVEEFFVGSPS